MSEALEQLQKIGAQKIYEQTHIPAEHVQAILHGSFEGFNKVQFIGFISILEREYGLKLQTVKLKGIAYFDDASEEEEVSIFLQQKEQKRNRLLYILLFGVVFVVVMLVYFLQSNTVPIKENDSNSTLQQVQAKVEEKKVSVPQSSATISVDENRTQSQVQTQTPEKLTQEVVQQTQEEPKKVPEILVIHTKKPLWIGYIDVQNNIKKQLTIKESFSLDPSKEWLLVLGHGYVSFDIGGDTIKFQKTKGPRLHYKDGKLQEIPLKEFKRLNRGNVW